MSCALTLTLLDCSQESHIPRLITPAEKGRDLEARVIDTYIIQSQAEAQEGKNTSASSSSGAAAMTREFTVCVFMCLCVFSDYSQSHRAEAQRRSHSSAGIRDS